MSTEPTSTPWTPSTPDAPIPVSGTGFTRNQAHLAELASQQGVGPVRKISDLASDVWPADETADEFIAEIRRLRSERLD